MSCGPRRGSCRRRGRVRQGKSRCMVMGTSRKGSRSTADLQQIIVGAGWGPALTQTRVP
jgi:hypothetical protein